MSIVSWNSPVSVTRFTFCPVFRPVFCLVRVFFRVLVLGALFAQAHSTVLASECSTSKCYIDAYNSLDTEDLPLISRVHDIFQTLSRTIGAKKSNRAKLLVIDSDGYPWAVALSDNTVVLTRGAIEKIYQGDDIELSDARAAFILGHELSHLITDDLFHHKAFVAARRHGNINADWVRPRPADENRADFNGFLYAIISGYQTIRLIEGDNGFFDQWLDQLEAIEGISHPNRHQRAEFVREGFENVVAEVPYYKIAVMLAHFGHYKDAQYLFEDFLNKVETQHAYSNLGYVYLQRARQEMPESLAYKYWIPTLLEPRSGLESNKSRSLFQQTMPSSAIKLLKMAETQLKLSVEMNDDDLASHVNLAAVYMYLPNKIHRAYASIEDARNTTLGKSPSVATQLESIYQLIRVADDDDSGDRWPKARDILKGMAAQSGTPENILYNLARMLDDRGRDGAALKYWQLLHQRLVSLPRMYQIRVCERLGLDDCVATGGADERNSSASWLSIDDLPIGKDIRYPDVQKYLTRNWGYQKTPPKILEGLSAGIFTNKHGDRLLALDNFVEMMVKAVSAESELSSVGNVLSKFGKPMASLPTGDGFILSYRPNLSVLIRNSRVVEIWLSGLSHPVANRQTK